MYIRNISDLEKLRNDITDQQIKIAEETYVKRKPQKGDCTPNPDYRLKSTEKQIALYIAKYCQKIEMEDVSYDALASIMIENTNVFPEIFQNIDEWVQGKPLSSIPFGPLGLTVPYIIERRKLFGYGIASDDMYEISEGFLDYDCEDYLHYPFFPAVRPIPM